MAFRASKLTKTKNPSLVFHQQAGRKNKEAARAASSVADEQARRVTDRLEATARAEERSKHIQRASKKLYESTERVSSFHSSLLLSDVLFEREAQIQHAETMKSRLERHDATFVREQTHAIAVASTAEEIKLTERRARAAETKDFVLAQIEEMRSNARAEFALDKKEGAMIRQRALEEAEEQVLEKEQKRATAVADAAATAKANDALKAHRFAEAVEAAGFEKSAEAFARRKELTNLARAARETAKRAEAQVRRDKIVAVMETQLCTKQNEDESRYTREAAVVEAGARRKEQAVAADRAEDVAMIHRSRQQQLAIREHERSRARDEETAEVARWQLRSVELEAEEQETVAQTKAEARRIQTARVNQMRRKQAKARFELEQEMEDHQRGRLAMEQDDALFAHYADTCVAAWAAQGKSTRPMLVELAKPRDRVTRVGYSVD